MFVLVSSDFETQLREVSLRVTQPRLAVLATLRDHPHIDTDSVFSLVRADLPAVSRQAIYDVLHALTDPTTILSTGGLDEAVTSQSSGASALASVATSLLIVFGVLAVLFVRGKVARPGA